MSSESTTSIPLQFETAVPAATGNTLLAANAVVCGSCQQSLIDEYYDVNGASVCGRCRGVVFA